jgi:Rrf2 family protein
MLPLLHTTTYALRALACVARHSDRCFSVRRIAQCSGVPIAYLMKIMRQLESAGWVRIQRGRRGGVRLRRSAAALRLYDVCRVLETDFVPAGCPFRLAFCDGRGSGCPLHDFWMQWRREWTGALRKVRLADIAAQAPGRGAKERDSEKCKAKVKRV